MHVSIEISSVHLMKASRYLLGQFLTHSLNKRKVLKIILKEDYFSFTIFLVAHTSRRTLMEIRTNWINLDFFSHPCYL